MIEKIGKAIAKASRELHMVYGLFDYSSYGKISKPHVVRDFTKIYQNIGEFDTSEEAQAFYRKICEEYVVKAAVKAMREPSDEMMLAACTAAGHADSVEFQLKTYQAMIDEILK